MGIIVKVDSIQSFVTIRNQYNSIWVGMETSWIKDTLISVKLLGDNLEPMSGKGIPFYQWDLRAYVEYASL